ncbi:hypothetical protein HZF05_12885 [Sphingomonas sp. CGMCC 1.13654]|uniref:Uncharacterized protein n=1 Tax=Sphingomonas chungangi TaxID=2683589 RepID=A0A838L774_9SPHN|nr:hypothetical protein [Sphingomonas chungangi]MBA2934994.1 hypothetical protein [Sphingomonas chungangi]MVW58304.1 hypothetical protein [Sphingomonas chungangi]
MNRSMVACFMAGAAGGAFMSFLVIALLRIMVLDPQDQATGLDRLGTRMDGLENRIQRLELNSGQLDPRDAQRAGAPQRGALD